MQNRPFRTPIVALLIHLGVTILFTCAPPAGDAFNFVVKLSSYPTTVLLTAATLGLIKLRLSKAPDEGQPVFRAPWAIVLFYLAGSTFLVIMPFIPPHGDSETSSLPYWLSPVVALGILGLGFIYYAVPFILLPLLFGYRLQPSAVQLTDGSYVTRYKRKIESK